MIKPEDEVVIVTDRYYAKQDIVAKLLGWMQGCRRLSCIQMNQNGTGVIAEHLPYMQGLIAPVNIQLLGMRDEAQQNLYAVGEMIKAAEIAKDDDAYNAAIHLIADKDAAIAACDALMDKAAQYARDVDDEISKGDNSAFEFSHLIESDVPEPLYTVKSVEQWSLKKYGLSVIDFANSEARAEKFRVESIASEEMKQAQINTPTRTRRVRQRNTELSTLIDSILEVMPNPTAGKVMAELRKAIKDPDSCVICTAEDGVQWEDIKGVTKTLNSKALAARIVEWQNLPLAN